MMSEDNETLRATQEAITAAGRALATTGTVQAQANNADMADYTCQYWAEKELDGGNPRDNEGTDTSNWAEIAGFEAIVAAINVD